MPESDLIEIRVSRVIPSEKWRIIRLITKVWEFPSYMPNVKEASVIQKSRNKIKTKWLIQVDKIPISWVEEDTLLLEQGTIQFEAVEGDLQEFKGKWIFKDHPEGTEVLVNVFLRVGIPAIKEFVDVYIEKLVTRNF